MILCILSDLHIGARKEFDTFHWKTPDFIAILDYVRQLYNVDETILNGDTYDLYQHSFQLIKEANTDIIEYFEQNNFIQIRGNHDISVLPSLQSYDITNKKGKKIHIEHGHLGDLLSGTAIGRKIGHWGFKVIKEFMHIKSFQDLFMKIVKQNDYYETIPRKYDTYKYLKYALKLLRNYDFVVFGHTHKLEEHKTFYLNSKKIYVNTGTCSLGRFQCIILDTETLKYESIKWGKKKVQKILNKIKNPSNEFDEIEDKAILS